MNFTMKLVYTGVVYYLFLQLALRYGISGPTLADLKNNLGVTLDGVSKSIAIMCVGICIGAVSSGFVVNYIKRELLTFILISVTLVICCLITFVPQFWLFLGLNLLVGISSGAAISLCESWILEIWGNECGPYMQALQFFRGLGYIIAPLLADPFLSEAAERELEEEELDGVIVIHHNHSTTTSATPVDEEFNERIHIPYLITGAMFAVGAALLAGLYFYRLVSERKAAQNPGLSNSDSKLAIISGSKMTLPGNDAKIVAPDPYDEMIMRKPEQTKREKYFSYAIVLISCIFYLFFYEESLIIFLPEFAKNIEVHLTKSQASLLTTIFSLSNVLGKAVGVGLALKLSHFILLYINLSIMVGSLVIIIAFGGSNVTLLWVGVCLHGVGLSSIIASLYTLMESSVEMNPLICGLLNMSGTLGSVFMPLVVGPFLEDVPMVLMYACIVSACICIALYITMHVLLRNKNSIIKSR